MQIKWVFLINKMLVFDIGEWDTLFTTINKDNY